MHGGSGDAFAGRPDPDQIVGAQGGTAGVTSAAGDVDNHLAMMVDAELDACFATVGNGSIDVVGECVCK